MNNEQNDFLTKMKKMLGDEFEDFYKSLSEPSQKSLYVNESKIYVEDFKQIINFDIKPIKYEKAGFYIDDEKRGRHSLHHAGAFYLQEPSAMMVAHLLDVKKG